MAVKKTKAKPKAAKRPARSGSVKHVTSHLSPRKPTTHGKKTGALMGQNPGVDIVEYPGEGKGHKNPFGMGKTVGHGG